MHTPFAFKFANSSTALKDIHDVRYRNTFAGHAEGLRQTKGLRQGKPIHAFFTQGMQIVGVPPELIAVVGRPAIASLNGGINFSDVGKGTHRTCHRDKSSRLITSVHMETLDAIYLLRIENQIYMAMPE
jgi:hypothetical protein